LSALSINSDILCARIFPLLLLIQKLSPPHKKNRDKNPHRKATPGRWRISAATIKQAIAILHQGKYRHAAKLNRAINKKEMMNFIDEFILTISLLSVLASTL
jgi:hypothetical protein